MLNQARHPRVEDIGQGVLAEIFLGENPQDFCELIVLLHPQAPQGSNTSHMLVMIGDSLEEFPFIQALSFEETDNWFPIPDDEGQDVLSEDFGNVLALTNFWFGVVKGLVFVRDVLFLGVKLFLGFLSLGLQNFGLLLSTVASSSGR